MVRKAEKCFLSPADEERIYKKKATVKGVERFEKSFGVPGDNVGVLLDVPPDQVKPGDIIVGKQRRRKSTDE